MVQVRPRFSFVTVVASALLAASAASAQSTADFYKANNSMRMVIAAGVGGGNDTYARVFARHWRNHIPGNPRIVPENRPGAGGVIALNFLYNVAPQDGSYVGVVNRSILTYTLMEEGGGAEFDINKLHWLGSINSEISLVIARADVPVRTAQDLRTRGLMIGATANANDSVRQAVLLNNVLGTRFRIVAGYPSGEAINLAIKRGEVEGRGSIPWTTLRVTEAEWLRDKQVTVLLQFALNKHPDLPDVPLALDLAETDEQRQIIELHAAKMDMGRPFVAPPGVPGDRLADLRKAFMATFGDAAFKAEADKLQLELSPMSGEAMQAALAKIYATPPDVVRKARDAYNAEIKLEMAKIEEETFSGKIAAVRQKGARLVIRKDGGETELRVGGSSTKVTIAGKDARRDALQADMDCSIRFAGDRANSVDCK